MSPPRSRQKAGAAALVEPANGRPLAAGGLTWFEASLDSIALLRFSNVAVVGVTCEGLIASWNRGAEAVFGYTREEAIGRSIEILCPPESLEDSRRMRALAELGQPTEPLEVERVAKDGRRIRLVMAVSPVRDAQGRVIGTASVSRDITGQREAEVQLRASEERHRLIVEALHDGVIVISREGRVLSCNPSAYRILGDLELGEAIANNTAKGVVIDEEGRPLPYEQLPHMVALRSGRAHHHFVVGVIRRDGSVCWLECTSAPLLGEGERESHAALVSFKDITAEKEARDALNAARLEDLNRLALVSEFRDDETRRHTERVARAAQLIAQRMGLSEEFVWLIGKAAPLHDVGKVGIPDAILLKPGKLTDEEFALMKRHTSIGADILAQSDFRVLQMGMEIALTHHERFDGGGYPRGLRGEQIPLCGRIVAVADAFDAMTHDRPYRKAIPPEQAVEELRRCAGAQFDPRVVEAFLALDYAELVDRG